MSRENTVYKLFIYIHTYIYIIYAYMNVLSFMWISVTCTNVHVDSSRSTACYFLIINNKK